MVKAAEACQTLFRAPSGGYILDCVAYAYIANLNFTMTLVRKRIFCYFFIFANIKQCKLKKTLNSPESIFHLPSRVFEIPVSLISFSMTSFKRQSKPKQKYQPANLCIHHVEKDFSGAFQIVQR